MGKNTKKECVMCLVAQLCLAIATPWILARQAPLSMGILQARILKWGCHSSSRGSSQPRDLTQVSRIVDRFSTVWATREVPSVFQFILCPTHSSVLAWRIPGMGEPGGLLSMGSHRVGHDWSDLAAAAAAYSVPKYLKGPLPFNLHHKEYTWYYCLNITF